MSALTITSIIPSLSALMVAVEGQNDGTPPAAVRAFRSAIRRKGVELAEVGGLDAMSAGIASLLYQAPDKADRRLAYLADAWAGLTSHGGGGSA